MLTALITSAGPPPTQADASRAYVKESTMAEPSVDYRDDQKARQIHNGSSSSDNEELGSAVNINENALLRKIDFRLLPAVGILYLLSFLDRSNVANARIEGLADDLGMSESICLMN